MTEEIEDYHQQLLDVCAEIEEDLEDLPNLQEHEKPEEMAEIEQQLKWAKQLLMSYRVELRELTVVEAARYQQKTKDHTARLQKLQADFNWAKKEVDRGQLGLAGGRAPISNNPDDMTAGQIIAKGEAIQEQSLESLARSKRMVQDTIEVATSTNEALQEQTAQIVRIQEDVERVESNLKRADRQLRAFMRRMMTDKIILCMICLVILGIIGAIVYSTIKGKDDKNTESPDEFKPSRAAPSPLLSPQARKVVEEEEARARAEFRASERIARAQFPPRRRL